MRLYQRTWTKDISSESKMYPDSVYMYDAGNFVGILCIKENTKQWIGYSVVSRVKTQDTIEEVLESVDEFSVPMKFFSIEQYPARIESSTLWIPGWKIQTIQQQQQEHQQQQQQKQQQQKQQQHHAAEASGSQLSQRPPLKQHRRPGQNQPSLQPAQSHPSSSSPHLQKSLSGRQGQSQHPLQNKRNSAPKPRVSPSSNPASHERQTQSIQAKSGAPLAQSSQGGHISPLSHQHPQPTFQPSLSLLPPSRPGGANLQSTSSSPNPSNLKPNLPSQQARRPREGMSQHPISSQMFSHE